MMTNTKADKIKILLVDDDHDLLRLISLRLKANNYRVSAVDNAKNALSQLATFRPNVVITDLKMPEMDGMALFTEIQNHYPSLPVIILTANGTIPDAVAATQKGVFSYMVKPFDADLLLSNLGKALRHGAILPDNNDSQQAWRAEIISRSESMESLLQQAHAVAKSDISILIQSQTGTGKELLARAIHKASLRRNKIFMTLNCAAIPESLIESELFGHTAGSFTGANKAHKGLFLSANGGTIFLDEIGDMPVSAQAKLLRVLEQQEVRPLGSTRTESIDVRIIAATHQDLMKKIEDKTFREDLYYRLNAITLELPPLSERREDIPILADYFCHQIAKKNAAELKRFSPEAAELLLMAPWPGNVRQLNNVVEQCDVLSSTNIISQSLVERSLRFKPEKLLGLNEARDQFERNYLVRLLNLTEGNIALASRLAKRNRTEFYKLLRRHELELTEFRNND